MSVIALSLPLPPLENHGYLCRGNRKVKGPEARAYEDTVWRACLEQGLQPGGQDVPKGDLELLIQLYLKHDRDVSGNKHLQDSLALALGFNDRQITRLVVTKEMDRANPRAEVVLKGSAADTVRRAMEVLE